MMKDKIKILENTKNKLKLEFIGIDDIIDKVIDSITPWFLTPEILERPTVVSLWGLTGTGKTSLVKKLISYLGISDKSLFFDCGEQGGNSEMKLFSEKLDDLFESFQLQEEDPRYSGEKLEELGLKFNDKQQKVIPKLDPINYTFVFDEFQYLHTKEPDTGFEELRPEGRAIWGLMDSGQVDINNINYKIKSLISYIEDLEFFSDEHPNVKIEGGYFNKSINNLLRQQLSYYRWSDDYLDEGLEAEEKSENGYRILLNEDYSFLIRRLNMLQKGLGFEVGDKIEKIKTLSEFIKYIKEYIDLLSKPKVINCSKSLIFVIGNLDEAFGLGNTEEDIDPDIDADVFHSLTSQVNCINIKTALRRRFRDEQIGRLGNNIIIYPSLRKKDFEEIIERELTRIKDKFKTTSGKVIKTSVKFSKLIYSEGCYPIQGVRPLFSTINTFISPLLSLIFTMNNSEEEYILDVEEDDFNAKEITLQIKNNKNEIIDSKKMILNLGALRMPNKCKKLGLQAIHEASHSVIYYLLTGKCPSVIIASNVFGNGGYMINDITPDISVSSISDLKTELMVSLAGYYGEREFFDTDKCSLGSSSDINNSWEYLRDAFYESGLDTPIRYSSESGISDNNLGKPYGYSDKNIQNVILKFFNDVCNETVKLIHQERKAIQKVALELYKKRCLGSEDFNEIVSKYLTQSPNKIDDNYYFNIINNELE